MGRTQALARWGSVRELTSEPSELQISSSPSFGSFLLSSLLLLFHLLACTSHIHVVVVVPAVQACGRQNAWPRLEVLPKGKNLDVRYNIGFYRGASRFVSSPPRLVLLRLVLTRLLKPSGVFSAGPSEEGAHKG